MTTLTTTCDYPATLKADIDGATSGMALAYHWDFSRYDGHWIANVIVGDRLIAYLGIEDKNDRESIAWTVASEGDGFEDESRSYIVRGGIWFAD